MLRRADRGPLAISTESQGRDLGTDLLVHAVERAIAAAESVAAAPSPSTPSTRTTGASTAITAFVRCPGMMKGACTCGWTRRSIRSMDDPRSRSATRPASRRCPPGSGELGDHLLEARDGLGPSPSPRMASMTPKPSTIMEARTLIRSKSSFPRTASICACEPRTRMNPAKVAAVGTQEHHVEVLDGPARLLAAPERQRVVEDGEALRLPASNHLPPPDEEPSLSHDAVPLVVALRPDRTPSAGKLSTNGGGGYLLRAACDSAAKGRPTVSCPRSAGSNVPASWASACTPSASRTVAKKARAAVRRTPHRRRRRRSAPRPAAAARRRR